MSILVVVELTCDRCGRTDDRRLPHANVVSGEQFVKRQLAGWNVSPHGQARCPACLAKSFTAPPAAQR